MGFLFSISMDPLEKNLLLRRKDGLDIGGHAPLLIQERFWNPWGSRHCLRSDAGQLWPTPRNLIFPFPFQSCLLNSDSSTGELQGQATQAGLLVSPLTLSWTPDVELESGNVTLPSFFTRLRKILEDKDSKSGHLTQIPGHTLRMFFLFP